MKQPLTTSNVSILLWATGWIAVAIGIVSAIAVLHDNGNAFLSDLAMAVGGLSSGFVFIGLGSIVDRLSKIEHHLRPEDDGNPVKSHSDYAPPNKLTCDWCGDAFPSNLYLQPVDGRGFLCEKCRMTAEP